MKTLTLKAIAITTLLASSGFALADYPLSAYEKRQLVNVCEAVKENKVTKLRRMVKNTGFSLKALQRGVLCNGVSLVDFAIQHSADNTAIFIAKRARLDPNVVIAKLNKTDDEKSAS